MVQIFVAMILISVFMCSNDEPHPWTFWMLEAALFLLLVAILLWPV